MIVVGTTLTGFAMSHPKAWGSWLETAYELRHAALDAGHDVRFFAAIETDHRGLRPFDALATRLREVNGLAAGGIGAPWETPWWTYSLDDGRTEVTSGNRLGHICAGRNLVTEYGCVTGATHILFLDADMCPPADTIPKLLEMKHPLAGGHVPTYGLRGPSLPHYPYPVEEHWNTAGFLLAAREVFRRIRWRWDGDAGMTDDPCYDADAREWLGVPTYVRKDVVGRHWPESIPAVEQRGYDMSVYRREADTA